MQQAALLQSSLPALRCERCCLPEASSSSACRPQVALLGSTGRTKRSRLTSLSNGAVEFEKFVDVEGILKEASAASGDFVFEDNDDDSDVWLSEKNFMVAPPTEGEEASEPQVKGALDPDQADILSAYSSEQGFREVTVEELNQNLDTASEGAFVLDVRSAWEFSRGHIPGATNINMDDLSAKVKSGALDHVRNITVAVVCASGLRSAQAAVRLHRVFGFQDVVNVKGGTTEWIKHGFDVDM